MGSHRENEKKEKKKEKKNGEKKKTKIVSDPVVRVSRSFAAKRVLEHCKPAACARPLSSRPWCAWAPTIPNERNRALLAVSVAIELEMPVSPAAFGAGHACKRSAGPGGLPPSTTRGRWPPFSLETRSCCCWGSASRASTTGLVGIVGAQRLRLASPHLVPECHQKVLRATSWRAAPGSSSALPVVALRELPEGCKASRVWAFMTLGLAG